MERVTLHPMIDWKEYGFRDRDRCEMPRPARSGPVEIGNDVWIGTRVLLLQR